MPYREDKPLSDIIPPDRRRTKMIALVAIGMVMGACVLYALQQATKDPPTVIGTATAQTPQLFAPATLTGPDGTFYVPARGKATIVHVWLQACADCMPAFEAMQHIERETFEAEVINVAYGSADPQWAARYGVRKNLVFDHGGAKVVKPLGISSFTTIVFDEDGREVARDRPDRPGYVERIRGHLRHGPLTATDVQEVVSTKHEVIRDRCWNLHRELDSADVTISAVVGGDGRVVAATGRGTNEGLTRCLEAEVRSWRFRATGGASVPVDIPFKLRRDE